VSAGNFSGLKKASFSDGTTTVTVEKISAQSSGYSEKILSDSDFEGKLRRNFREIKIDILSYDVANAETIISWMKNRTAITSTVLYFADGTVTISASMKIIGWKVMSAGKTALRVIMKIKEEL